MIDRTLLATLAAVLRTGSFDRAAAALAVTPSAVSQRIKLLEEQVGTTLVLRGSPATGTTQGDRLARHAEDVDLLESALIQDLGGMPTSSRVRIAVNADSLATWFIPALAGQKDKFFDLLTDDQDHSAEWLLRGDVAAAVTSQSAPLNGCDCLPLGLLRYRAFAAPSFADMHFSEGINAERLAKAPAIIFNQKDELQDRWAAKVTGKRVVLNAHYIPSTHGFIDAAIAGLGWGLNPAALVDPLIKTGALVDIAADAPLDVPLYWQIRRVTASALRPLTQSVVKSAKSALLQVNA